MLPKIIRFSRCSSSSLRLVASDLNPNPSDSAGGSSSHPEKKRKQQKGSDEGGERGKSDGEESAGKKLRVRGASRSRRRDKGNSRGASGKITPEKGDIDKPKNVQRFEQEAEVGGGGGEGTGEGEGEGGGQRDGEKSGYDQQGRKPEGEEGGSWETGWTDERGINEKGTSERGKEEAGVVSGGSADSTAMGALQKARRKPGPDRKDGPVTKACVDSRVSQ